jgi:hypothetical protein
MVTRKLPEMAYRGGLARVCLRQVRALPEAGHICRVAGEANVAAIEEVSAFAWLPAAPYHELMKAIRAELGPEGNLAFWRAWVAPFVKTPLIKLSFEGILQLAGLGPGPLLGLVPRFRQLSLKNAGTLSTSLDEDARVCFVRFADAPAEFWAEGTQIEALVGCLYGAFDLSGVPGKIVVEELDVARGRATLRMSW